MEDSSIQFDRSKIINELIQSFSCPLEFPDYFNEGIKNIFLRKWFYVIADSLPSGIQDIPFVIEDSRYDVELSADDFDEFDDSALIALSKNNFRVSDIYHKLYTDTCEKFLMLKAQTRKERAKHYPKNAKILTEVQLISNANKNIGYMLPNFPPEKQLEFFWNGISDAFERLESDNELINKDYKTSFEAVWNMLFNTDSYRLSIDTMTTIGYYNGEPCTWIIYDVSVSGSVVHCYPALNKVSNSYCAAIDDLQGISSEIDFSQ